MSSEASKRGHLMAGLALITAIVNLPVSYVVPALGEDFLNYGVIKPGYYLTLIPAVICGCIGFRAMLVGMIDSKGWTVLAGVAAVISAIISGLYIIFVSVVVCSG